jgi:large subunit ribosomal protein L25
MSSSDVVLEAAERTEVGKGSSGRLRRAGKIPAVVYGAAKESKALEIVTSSLVEVVGHTGIVELKVGGETKNVLVREVQQDLIKNQILHIDFEEVRMDQKVKATVSLHFFGEGESAGTSKGGLLNVMHHEVDIECLPADLPESIDVDVSGLDLDETLSYADIKLPSGVEIRVDDADITICTIAETAAMAAEEEVVDVAEGDAEGGDADADGDGDGGDAAAEQDESS